MESLKKHLPGRRSFLGSGLGAGAAAMASTFWAPQDLEAATQSVNTRSKPSDLKITDMRVAMISRGGPAGIPVIRLDTNQGIYGLGEVRDGAPKNLRAHAEEPPTGRESLQRGQGVPQDQTVRFSRRQAGGVCGVEMALWDLAGKALQRACLPVARRQVPRPGANLLPIQRCLRTRKSMPAE